MLLQGTFGTVVNGSGTGCQTCPPGTTTVPGFAAAFASDCSLCLPGFGFGPNGSCQQCPAGTYSPGGATSCLLCPLGSSSAPGSNATTDCFCNVDGWVYKLLSLLSTCCDKGHLSDRFYCRSLSAAYHLTLTGEYTSDYCCCWLHAVTKVVVVIGLLWATQDCTTNDCHVAVRLSSYEDLLRSSKLQLPLTNSCIANQLCHLLIGLPTAQGLFSDMLLWQHSIASASTAAAAAGATSVLLSG